MLHVRNASVFLIAACCSFALRADSWPLEPALPSAAAAETVATNDQDPFLPYSDLEESIGSLYDAGKLRDIPRAQYTTLVKRADALPDGFRKNTLEQRLSDVNATLTQREEEKAKEEALKKQEEEASAAVATIWDGSSISDSADDASLQKIEHIVDALPDGDKKTDLANQLDQAKNALQKRQEAAERKKQEESAQQKQAGQAGNAQQSQGGDKNTSNGIPKLDGRLGPNGRFYIPEVGVNVALFGTSQSECDAKDSACDYRGEPCVEMIADHKTQGFDRIKSVTPGSTKAYIYRSQNTVETYLCSSIQQGINNEDDLIVSGQSTLMAPAGTFGDLLTYTCNEDWRHVTAVTWTRIS